VQLNESNIKFSLFFNFIYQYFLGQTTARHVQNERDKYLQIYARTHEHFVAFEKKQLEQMRHVLRILTYDQYKVVTGKKNFLIKDFSIIYLFRNYSTKR
jgi:hypothetical protein